jgi:predicted nucleic acid-binding protein
MIVIADANIIISALITPKGVNGLILNSKNKVQFIAPDYLKEEVKNHWD